MKPMIPMLSLLMLSAAWTLPAFAGQQASARAKTPTGVAHPNDGHDAETAAGTKVVQYAERDVVKINSKIRYTTLIILPKNEVVLDFTCGDKEFWIVDGNQNFVYVKPAKVGAQTNLNLVTAKGNVYSFVLTEVSDIQRAEPDLKVYVETKDMSTLTIAGDAPRFVSIRELEASRQELERAKEETRQTKAATEAAVDARVSGFITNVRFVYRFEAGKKPFYLRAMYHDDKFTYIQARPEETPTLYEVLDGKPNQVNFTYDKGIYIVDKILDRGYVVVGKKRLAFVREE